MKKKLKKNKKNNLNQTSFYFEDYLETNKKKKSSHKINLFAMNLLTFFYFFSLILIL